MSSSPPILYAELLPHIRQISVIASLHTPCDQSTKAELSPDGYRFTLHHGGAATILQLPGQVGVSSQLQEPLLGRRELSWRLPLATPLSQAGVEDVQSIASPWNAAALTPDAEFSCRGCGSLVVGKGTVKTWKDLPSENWAEMMDFWHCHKPDVPHTHTHGSSDHAAAVPDKGYGANTKFSAAIGVGFVDLTTFLLSDSDCTALQVRRFSVAVGGSFSCGYQEGGHPLRKRFSSLVTDTNTQDYHHLDSHFTVNRHTLFFGLWVTG
jgi:hypothetical protein